MISAITISPKDLDAVKGADLFNHTPPEILAELIDASEVRAFRHRAFVYRPNQTAGFIYIALRGKFRVLRGPSDGKHAVLAVPRAGMAFGLEDALAAGRYSATAQAVGASRALRVPASRYLAAATGNPEMANDLVVTIARSLRDASDQMELIQLKPTAQRLGDYLLRLAPAKGHRDEFSLPHEKSLIAAYLGMEPESLSRALKDLQAVGVANRGRRVRISDVDRLRAFCEPVAPSKATAVPGPPARERKKSV